jgi:TRAP transporter 4TM/12TM fusion protein
MAETASAAADPSAVMPEELDHRQLGPGWAAAFAALTTVALALVLNQLLNLQLLVGVVFIENRYLYLLAACLLPLVFVAYPAWPRAARDRVPAYDMALAAAALSALLWFAGQAERALEQGWEFGAPALAVAASALLWLIVLEALRRTGGLAIALIVLAVSLYPVVADRMPGPVAGLAQSLPDTLAYHMLSAESAFGIPMRAFGEIVIGFIVFGVALNHTGGGKFFNDVAFALVGRVRGGAAQVGVVSSALQGSISGSVISNVISSGVVTIPAMKRTGFAADYAGGVEAVASTGAVLMPPVMGSTAFVMAAFLGRPYGEIALAAAVPALLFYFGLMVQIDAYSARRGLRGLRADELPRLKDTLRDGWIYILVFAVLVVFMLEQKQEALAPFYATAVLLVVNQIWPRHRMGWRQAAAFLAAVGRALAELAAILAGVGFIIGAFSMTGLAGTLANDLVYVAGGAPLVLLVMGAVTSFIFGMGMTVTACYIFLAIVLAPPLVRAGMDPLAVHLFIMYWGMVSFITPPVALAAFAAAPIARTGFFRIGFQAMRLGTIIYLIPFFFVLNPALILKGPWSEVAAVIATAFIGVWLIAGALQGYLAGFGPFRNSLRDTAARTLALAGGLALALPGGAWIGIDTLGLAAIGAALTTAAFALMRAGGRGAAVLTPEPLP